MKKLSDHIHVYYRSHACIQIQIFGSQCEASAASVSCSRRRSESHNNIFDPSYVMMHAKFHPDRSRGFDKIGATYKYCLIFINDSQSAA